jgi:hypothetical protein
VLSLFREEIRRFLKIAFTVPPKKMRALWRAFRLEEYQYQLSLLKERHNNPYNLILYTTTKISGAFLYGVAGVPIVTIYSFWGSKLGPDHSSVTFLALLCIMDLLGVTFFVALGVLQVYIECCHLVKYDERVVYLEKKIAELS